MLFGIFLLHRRRQQIILRIIIDHGLGQDAVFGLGPHCGTQLTIHKGQYLIHIQINIRNVFRLDIFYFLQTCLLYTSRCV